MSDIQDDDLSSGVVDSVDDAIVSDAHPPAVPPAQFESAWRPGVLCELVNRRNDAPIESFGQSGKGSCSAWQREDTVGRLGVHEERSRAEERSWALST